MTTYYSGTFETGLDGWTGATSSPTVSRTSSYAHAGAFGMEVVPTQNATCEVLRTVPITVTPGGLITVAFWSRATAGPGRDGQVVVNEQSSTGGYLSTQAVYLPTLVAATAGQRTAQVRLGATTARIELHLNIYNAGTGDRLNFDDVTVADAVVANAAPTATAGPAQTVDVLEVAQLAGAGTDPEGGALTYGWAKVSGPAGVFSSTTIPGPTYTPQAAGAHVLALTVTDPQGASSSAQMTLTALAGHRVLVRWAGATVQARRYVRVNSTNEQTGVPTAGAPTSAGVGATPLGSGPLGG